MSELKEYRDIEKQLDQQLQNLSVSEKTVDWQTNWHWKESFPYCLIVTA